MFLIKVKLWREVLLVFQGYCKQVPQTVNNKNVLSPSSGDQKSEIKVLSGFVPGLFLNLWCFAGNLWCLLAYRNILLISTFMFTRLSFPGCVSVSKFPLMIRKSVILDQGPALLHYNLILTYLIKSATAHFQIRLHSRGLSLVLQHMNLPERQNSTHNRTKMEIQVYLMAKTIFYPNMLILSKFCHQVSLTTEEIEMQYLTWCPVEEMGTGGILSNQQWYSTPRMSLLRVTYSCFTCLGLQFPVCFSPQPTSRQF